MNKLNNTVFESLTDVYLLALCIWAEARNQGLEGMQAVGSVILNRASRPGWWGSDIKSVILKPKQFSCLNEDDPQRVRMIAIAEDFINAMWKDPDLRACWWVAKGLIEPWPESKNAPALRSNVGAATHYHTSAVAPAWKDKLKLTARIKDHLFYEG
jgi:spore germination cell wall hydrolase CwlJ-like protein